LGLGAKLYNATELPDDAIGWVGGIGRNNIGKDVENKVHGMFMAGGRFGAGGVGMMKPSIGGGGGPKPDK
jgi:hypothetical protein